MSLSTTDSSELRVQMHYRNWPKMENRVSMGFGSEYTLSTHQCRAATLTIGGYVFVSDDA
jgi:hypothetical protein